MRPKVSRSNQAGIKQSSHGPSPKNALPESPSRPFAASRRIMEGAAAVADRGRRDRRLPKERWGTNMSVDDSPLTRASLLVQIRDGSNHAAWQEFIEALWPGGLWLRPQARPARRRRGRSDARRACVRSRQPSAGSTTTAVRERFAAGCSRSRGTRFSIFFRPAASARKARATRRPIACSTRIPIGSDGAEIVGNRVSAAARGAGHGTQSKASFRRTPGGPFG